MEVGDTVQFLPGEHLALQTDRNGDYAWVMGRRHTRIAREGGGPARQETAVEELSTNRVREYLAHLRRSPNPAEARKDLVFLRPAKPWPATVTAVNDDGTVDLDVPTGNGFTLHEINIKIDPSKKTPHTCHATEES